MGFIPLSVEKPYNITIPEDILIVSEISRLGRNLGQIIQLVDQLMEKDIRLIAIKESIDFKKDTQSMLDKAMIALFRLFAEIERDLISRRTKEGLLAAKASGKKLGRPMGSLGKSKLDGKEAEIRLLLEKDVSKESIAKILNVSRSGLIHYIESRRLLSVA